LPDDRFIHRKAGHGQKPNLLTDLEFRVWIQYMSSADDFGVMRGTHHQLQADNDHLASRPAKVIQRCLNRIVTVGLLRAFEHQGKPYVYQHDWQTWQKVAYPRGTNQPAPPPEAIAKCDEPTRKLFAVHPGGAGRKRLERSENVSETVQESSPLMRAGGRAKRLTANGERLTANGSEGGPGGTLDVGDPPPMDVWARELVNAYPAQGRCGWNLVERPLFDVLMADGGIPPVVAWHALLGRLEAQKRSYQWLVKQMIPRLDKWLREGLHLQELPEHPPSTLVSEKSARVITSGNAFVAGGANGPR
jgi:hypothetical protein